MENLLITGAFRADVQQLAQLGALGYNIITEPDERLALSCNVEEIDAVICNSLFLHTPIELFKRLKYIQLTSAGYDRVDMEYVRTHGIEIKNAAGVYSIPMAEFAICGILQLYKNSSFFYENRDKQIWEKCRSLGELCDKKACIIGAGNIGSQVALRLKPFVAHIVGVDLAEKQQEGFDEVICIDRLDEQLESSDIVILTLPLTKENEGFFNKDKFNLMRRNSVFVNIARGRLVDEQALVQALRENKIGGAVLDVFAQEPLPQSSALWQMEHVILTPHNSFVGENNQKRLFDLIIKNLGNRK